MFKVYKVTCQTTGMVYIGMTGQAIQKRWKQHVRGAAKEKSIYNRLLATAIKSFGENNFTVEQIAEAITKEKGWLIERETIAVADCMHPNGFNLNGGGGGKSICAETQQLYSETTKLWWSDPENYARGLLAIKRTPEQHQRSTDGIRAFFQNPDNRARHAIAQQLRRKRERLIAATLPEYTGDDPKLIYNQKLQAARRTKLATKLPDPIRDELKRARKRELRVIRVAKRALLKLTPTPALETV